MSIGPGTRVVARTRRGIGIIVYHHPHLPAWVVKFPGRPNMAYTYDQLTVAPKREFRPGRGRR